MNATNTTASAQFTQKEAVFVGYSTILSNRGLDFVHVGSLDPATLSSVRKELKENIASGIVDGSVKCDNERIRGDLKEATDYAAGLISNWFKKDERLSGGKYEPKSVRGPQVRDEKLKALAAAHKTFTAAGDMEMVSKIEAAQAKRQAEVAAEKAAKSAPSVDDAVAQLAELGIEL